MHLSSHAFPSINGYTDANKQMSADNGVTLKPKLNSDRAALTVIVAVTDAIATKEKIGAMMLLKERVRVR